MGERFGPQQRHSNVETVLRRIGIGHNGGPSLDMSGAGWIWRQAVAKAWKNPPREIALRRIARATGLGLTYREYTSVLLDTGVHISAALVPLACLVDLRLAADGAPQMRATPRIVEAIARFRGRMFCLVDSRRAEYRTIDCGPELYRLFDGRVEAVEFLDFAALDLHSQLREALKRWNVPRREAFFVGTTPADAVASEAAGMALFKNFAAWIAALSQK